MKVDELLTVQIVDSLIQLLIQSINQSINQSKFPILPSRPFLPFFLHSFLHSFACAHEHTPAPMLVRWPVYSITRHLPYQHNPMTGHHRYDTQISGKMPEKKVKFYCYAHCRYFSFCSTTTSTTKLQTQIKVGLWDCMLMP